MAISRVLLVATSSLFLLSAASVNAKLTVQAVIESIEKNHPKIQELAAKRAQAEQEEMAALGAFDPVIEQNTNLRLSGYYTGQFIEQKVSRRFQSIGGEMFGGYRLSGGSFPEYEGDYRTLGGGEPNIGVALSLLQNREIDDERNALQNALLKREHWRARERATRNQTLFYGLSAFLDWYSASLQYQVIRELVINSEERLEGIKGRVASGDLAQISLVEFEVTLLTRNQALQKAKLELLLAKEALVFYWRDEYGEMRPVTDIPDDANGIDWPYVIPPLSEAEIQRTIRLHPIVIALEAEQKQAINNERLSANDLLPTLDIEFKVARDVGGGSETLDGTETKLGLQFKMPLGFRTAKAKNAQAKLKVKEFDYALKDLTDSMSRDIHQAMDGIQFSNQILEMNEKTVKLTEKLLAQESIRFKAGASDLFLLNNREATAITAKLERIQARIDFYKQQLSYLAITAELAR